MKLLNQSFKYLSLSILGIISIWSIFFYINMVNEIKSSIDEGLENYKRLIVQYAHRDASILEKNYFDESFFTIQKIDKTTALSFKDQFIDTIVYMQDFEDDEPEPEEVRMLITAFEFKGEYYELKVANALVDKEDMIRAFFVNTIWLYISVIIGILIINNAILKRLWKPFYDLLFQLRNYRLDKTHNLPLVTTNTKEFAYLQECLTNLLTESKEVYNQQKIFIGNASHELQTPLAIAVNKLELLLERKDITDHQANDINDIYQIIQRMIRLNKSLLLLSKIENKQFIENQKISIGNIVRQTIEELEDYAEYKKITIEFVEHNPLWVEFNPALAHIIISNLLKNAIFHNIPNGKVDIILQQKNLKVINTGKRETLDDQKIFTQFYKSNTSNQGTGLGLAIVKAIIELYGLSISYSFKKQLHCLEINFRDK